MKLSAPTVASVKTGAWGIVRWIVSSGLLVGFLLALYQCSVARHDARTAALQTYNMGRVAAFRDSGAALDQKIAAFNDAAADGKDLTPYREAMHAAFAEHGAKTQGMKDAFGEADTHAYFSLLKKLQDDTDAASDGGNAGAIITAMSDVLVKRDELSKKVAGKAQAD